MTAARAMAVTGMLVALFLVVACSGPRYAYVQMQTDETRAIRSIRTLHTDETQYMLQFGRYATTLAQLASEKDGYLFTLTATPNGYTINANPKVYNSTGRRTFFSDQSLTIRQNWGQDPATATSPELGY